MEPLTGKAAVYAKAIVATLVGLAGLLAVLLDLDPIAVAAVVTFLNGSLVAWTRNEPQLPDAEEIEASEFYDIE